MSNPPTFSLPGASDAQPKHERLHEYLVEEVLDQWYGPQDTFFKVHADDGNLYILRRETSTPDGSWHLSHSGN